MKNSEQLTKEYNQLKNEVNKTLSNLISQNLGKNLLNEDEIDDGEFGDTLTFIDDMSGESRDFHFVGIASGGEILTIDTEGDSIDGMKINQIELWAKLGMIEMLENL